MRSEGIGDIMGYFNLTEVGGVSDGRPQAADLSEVSCQGLTVLSLSKALQLIRYEWKRGGKGLVVAKPPVCYGV